MLKCLACIGHATEVKDSSVCIVGWVNLLKVLCLFIYVPVVGIRSQNCK
jgi:hypothetical protein